MSVLLIYSHIFDMSISMHGENIKLKKIRNRSVIIFFILMLFIFI